jgi:hypothetical protein
VAVFWKVMLVATLAFAAQHFVVLGRRRADPRRILSDVLLLVVPVVICLEHSLPDSVALGRAVFATPVLILLSVFVLRDRSKSGREG